MKKIFSLILVMSLLSALLGLTTFVQCESDPLPTVFVTISDGTGKLVLCEEAINVEDIDNDEMFSVNDALYCVHEHRYNGGAESGYGCISTDYGLTLTKLWGVENGGSYGYYVNDVASMSLADEIKNGDRIYAFAYSDLTSWSDTYCWFDTHSAIAKLGDTLTLTLSCYTYDENFNAVVTPVKDAVITINGEKTDYKTGNDGKANIVIDKAGEIIVGAVSDTQTLVPPVCKLNVADASESTGIDTEGKTAEPVESDTAADTTDENAGSGNKTAIIVICAIAAVVVIGTTVLFIAKRKGNK